MDARLPAHIEVSGFLRSVQVAGGFGTILQKGEKDAGVILILTTHNGRSTQLWERMPQLDGSRIFTVTKAQDPENSEKFEEYLAKRRLGDPDSWMIELDIENPERFIATTPR